MQQEQYLKLDGSLTTERGRIHIEDAVEGQRLIALYQQITREDGDLRADHEAHRIACEAEADRLVAEYRQAFPEPPRAAGAALDPVAWSKSLWQAIVAAKAAGERVVLLRNEGGDFKRPAFRGWNDETDPKPTLADIRSHWQWMRENQIEVVGFGIVCGKGPHFTQCIDFDWGGCMFNDIADRVLTTTGIDIRDWPRQQRGTAERFHVYFRTSEALPKQKLAMEVCNGKPEVIAEVISNGQAVRAPSRHKSGALYRVVHGDINDPPVIDIADVRRVLDAIREFDQMPHVAKLVTPKPKATATTGGTSDDLIGKYNSEVGIVQALLDNGYVECGGDWMRHPSGENNSVHILEHALAHHFSPRDVAHRVSDKTTQMGVCTTPFDWYLHREHGGDVRAAVRALAERFGCAHERSPFSEADLVSDWNTKYDKPAAEDDDDDDDDDDFGPPASNVGRTTATATATPEKVEVYTPQVVVSDVTVAVPSKLEEAGAKVVCDLSWTPKRFRRMVRAFAKVNHFLPLDANVLPALFPASVLMGKRLVTHNGKYRYYANVWIALLLASGAGKSSLHILIEEELQRLGRYPVGSFTMAGLYRRGVVLNPKDFRTHQQNDTFDGWLAEQQAEAQRKLSGGFMLLEEATDKLKRALGAWDSKNPAADTGNLISVMDSASNMFNETKGAGFEALLDNCWSCFGTAQDAEWGVVMDCDQFVQRGLLTRFLHGGVGMEVAGFAPDEDFATAAEAQAFISSELASMKADADAITKQVVCACGVSDDRDLIAETINAYREASPVFAALRRYNENLAGYALTKLVSQAIKLSMIMAFFNRDMIDPRSEDASWGEMVRSRIDIAPYFPHAYDFLMRSFLGWEKHKTVVTDFVQQEERLLQLYRRLGKPISARDAMRSLRAFRRTNDAVQVFELLVRSGKWTAIGTDPDKKTGRPKSVTFQPNNDN